ncbi:holin [Solwaraspora sp. WMMD1047]|uniref:holin n=1 Tax=Solwaraspora sp. WMMD1047 TaxID=3016102 RepID=UPI0024180767|nr:holin [Solwaraspora sp. WMMD1047]MDG4832439.1 holin [Solwaraspora sp. WMMD1047]
MFTKKFWKGAGERLIKTFAQGFGIAAGLGEPGISVFNIDWQGAAGIGLGMALASLVTSIVSAPVGEPASPSLTRE